MQNQINVTRFAYLLPLILILSAVMLQSYNCCSSKGKTQNRDLTLLDTKPTHAHTNSIRNIYNNSLYLYNTSIPYQRNDAIFLHSVPSQFLFALRGAGTSSSRGFHTNYIEKKVNGQNTLFLQMLYFEFQGNRFTTEINVLFEYFEVIISPTIETNYYSH